MCFLLTLDLRLWLWLVLELLLLLPIILQYLLPILQIGQIGSASQGNNLIGVPQVPAATTSPFQNKPGSSSLVFNPFPLPQYFLRPSYMVSKVVSQWIFWFFIYRILCMEWEEQLLFFLEAPLLNISQENNLHLLHWKRLFTNEFRFLDLLGNTWPSDQETWLDLWIYSMIVSMLLFKPLFYFRLGLQDPIQI